MAADKSPLARAENWYAQFRGSKYFVIFLGVFTLTWMTMHVLFNFDADLGIFNSSFSVEASLMTSICGMGIEAVRSLLVNWIAEQRKHNDRMLALTEAVRDGVVANLDVAATIKEMLSQ